MKNPTSSFKVKADNFFNLLEPSARKILRSNSHLCQIINLPEQEKMHFYSSSIGKLV